MASADPQLRPISAEEFADMAWRYVRSELVEGVILEMGPTSGEHGSVEFDVAALVGAFVKANGLGKVYTGEVGFIVKRNPDTVYGADVAYLCNEKASKVPKRGFVPFAPDLAVEIVSPEDRWTEIRRKVDDWLAAGTLAVWVVDPERRTLDAFARNGHQALSESDVLSCGDVLPGFSVEISRLFGS
ncbi:MAG: Uma2 family endonuclease [Candidatus Sericytochromatia bacterium]|nr:Uma2 family endonuclease [Candidatus Tanganyikabacteria bacterium]